MVSLHTLALRPRSFIDSLSLILEKMARSRGARAIDGPAPSLPVPHRIAIVAADRAGVATMGNEPKGAACLQCRLCC